MNAVAARFCWLFVVRFGSWGHVSQPNALTAYHVDHVFSKYGMLMTILPRSTSERIKLSSVVEQLCQRVSKLHYIVTVVTQVQ